MENDLSVTGLLWGEYVGERWIPSQKDCSAGHVFC